MLISGYLPHSRAPVNPVAIVRSLLLCTFMCLVIGVSECLAIIFIESPTLVANLHPFPWSINQYLLTIQCWFLLG